MFTRKSKISGHSGPIYTASWDSSFLYTSSTDKFVARWDIQSGLQDTRFTVKLDHAAYTIETNETQCFIACTDGTICAINTQTKQLDWEINLFGNAWFSLKIVAENNWLLAGDAEGNLIALDLKTGVRIIHLPLAAGKIRAITVIHQQVFVCTQLIGILIFSLPTWNELASWEPNKLGSTAVIWDELLSCYVSVGKDGYLVLSDINFQITKRVPAHYQTIYGLLKLKNNWATCSMDKTIKLWNSDFSEVVQRIEYKDGGHNRSVNNVVKLSDELFVTVSDDKQIILWEATK